MEFSWFQAKPCQSLHLRLTEKQFLDGKKYIRSKSIVAVYHYNGFPDDIFILELLNMSFEQFTDLLTPVVACNAAEITDSILRSTFDCLFDQDSNGTIEQEEFQSLLILLNTFNSKADSERKSFINEILQETFSRRHNHLTFKGKAFASSSTSILPSFLFSPSRILRLRQIGTGTRDSHGIDISLWSHLVLTCTP